MFRLNGLFVTRAKGVISAFSLLWCSILISPARATTYTVCSDAAPNQCNFYSIPHALADRDSAPGCTLLVKAGTYRHPNGVFKATAMNASSGSPTVLKANGEVIIDGADPLGSGVTWTQVPSTNIFWTSRAANTTTVPLDSTQAKASYVFVSDSRYTYVDNNFTTLTAGEWSYDAANAKLYVHMANDASPAGQDISVTDSRRIQAFDIEWSDNFVIDGFTIKHMAGAGILIEGDESDTLIAKMLNPVVKDCTISNCWAQGIQLQKTTIGVVTNNTVYSNGGNGIGVVRSDSTSVTYNNSYLNHNPLTTRGGRAGIKIGANGTPMTTVRDVNVDYNVCHDNEDTGIDLTGANHVVVRRNVVYRNRDHGFDNNRTEYTAFINNTAFGNEHDGMSIENTSSNVSIYNCIFAYNAHNSATLASPSEGVWELEVNGATGFSSNNNVFMGWDPGDAGKDGARHLILYGGTPYDALTTGYRTASGQDSASYKSLPAFVDTGLVTYDFSIKANAAGSDDVIDAALTTIGGWISPMWLSVDPHGVPPHNAAAINQGSGAYVYADIGAYELDPRPRAVTSADDSIFAECVPGSEGQWRLNWKAVSDDSVSNGRPVAEYLVKYLDSSITEANWSSADSLGGPFPLSPGSWQGFYVQVGSTKHVRLKDRDWLGQWSGLSPELTIDAYPAGNCGGTWYVGGGGGGGGGGHEEGLRGPTLTSLRRPGSSPDLVGTGENTILNGTPSGTRGVDLVPIKAVQNDAGAYVAHVRVTDRYGTLVDGLKLLLVDHPAGTEAFAYGSTVVSGRRSEASQAVTEAGEDVTTLLNGTGGIFNAAAAVAVTVSTPLDASETPLVIECANGGVRGQAIIVESQTPSGWREVGVIYPRRVPSACVIDAVPPGPVRLRFTGYAYLSSVARLGRETTGVSNTWGTLESARSASAGDVLAAIGAEDTAATALVGPDTLVAVFAGPALVDGAVRNAFLGISATPVTAAAAINAAAQRVSSIPTRFALYQNVPNPFWGSTTIRLDLPVGRMVRLEIFDVSGRRVRTLVNHFMPAGRQSIAWNQRDDAGADLGAGVYFARVQVDTFRDRKKLILMP